MKCLAFVLRPALRMEIRRIRGHKGVVMAGGCVTVFLGSSEYVLSPHSSSPHPAGCFLSSQHTSGGGWGWGSGRLIDA